MILIELNHVIEIMIKLKFGSFNQMFQITI